MVLLQSLESPTLTATFAWLLCEVVGSFFSLPPRSSGMERHFAYGVEVSFRPCWSMVVRRVIRRGKALVSKAYIAVCNEHNEHGSFVPERRQPFRSSSSDVRKVVFRCNGDLQFKDRAVPADVVTDGSGAAEPATSEPSGRGGLFSESRSFSALTNNGGTLLRGGAEGVERGRLLHDQVPVQGATGALSSDGAHHGRSAAL